MKPANDSRLDTLLDASLGALPRERASDNFTRRVLEEAERREDHGQWRPLAAAFALLALGLGTYSWNERLERLEATERRAALLAEYELLQEELAEIETAKRERGVVYLGGTDDVELVLDLGRLVRGGRETGAEAAPSSASAAPSQDPAPSPAF